MRTRKALQSALTVFVLTTVSTATASDAADPLAPLVGERIRVGSGVRLDPHLAGSRTRPALVGVLESLDSETLTLSVDGRRSSIKIPRKEVRVLHVARGRRSIAGWTAGMGAVAGLVFGVLALSGVDDDITGGDVAAALLMSGAAGAGVGAVIGAPIKVDRWERVSTPPRAGVRFGPLRGGIAFSVSLPMPRQTSPDRSRHGSKR